MEMHSEQQLRVLATSSDYGIMAVTIFCMFSSRFAVEYSSHLLGQRIDRRLLEKKYSGGGE